MFTNSFPSRSGHLNAAQTRKFILDSFFDRGLPWLTRLSAHTSCVNALALSSKGGRFLASGGDDLSVLLWDLHQESGTQNPVTVFNGHQRNIFTLAFSANNKYLFSAGGDARIQQYDLSRNILPVSSPQGSDITYWKTASISSVSCHPFRDELFLSGCDDGYIDIYDTRAAPSQTRTRGDVLPSQRIEVGSEIGCVQYHPLAEHMIASSDLANGLCMRDLRMASSLSGESSDCVVRKYYTTLANQHGLTVQSNVSSVVFDREGGKMAATILNYLPTIYDTSDPIPLAVCSGKNAPDGSPHPTGERTYSNGSTAKHGSFGGPSLDMDEFYCAGSEDFRAYLWRIPPLETLREKRKVMSTDRPHLSYEPFIGFSDGSNKPIYSPFDLSTPLCRLTGHKSIVNSTLIHPTLPHVFTAGIERHIIMHSPTPASQCASNLIRSPARPRLLLPGRMENRIMLHASMLKDSGSQSLSEIEEDELETISMFDSILREEEENFDLFQ